MEIVLLNKNSVEEASLLTRAVIDSLEGIYSEEARTGECNKFTAENIEPRLTDPDNRDFIALDNDKVIGFVYSFVEANVLFIQWVGVDPSYRKKGIMKSLLSYVENFCKANRIATIWLDTNKRNEPAIRFFATNGFSKFCSIDNFWYGHDYYFWIKQLK